MCGWWCPCCEWCWPPCEGKSAAVGLEFGLLRLCIGECMFIDSGGGYREAVAVGDVM